jgi:hypothetical protein
MQRTSGNLGIEMNKFALLTGLFAILGPVSQVAFAGDVGQHPAIFASRSLPGIDASTFIVGHPAGGAVGHAPHANFDHPAVVMHRAGQSDHIDSNRFIVQPPATTVWTSPVAASVMTAAIRTN